MSSPTAPDAGDEVMVVFEENGARAVSPADVIQSGSESIDVILRSENLFPYGKAVTLLTGDGAESRYARIVSAERHDSRMTLRTGTWRAVLNRRGHPRYPMFLPCKLEARGSSVEGRCVDLSVGGAAIEVPAWNQQAFDLVLPGSPPLRVRCRTVAFESIFFALAVHVAFDDCAPDLAVAIESLVERGRLDFEDAQWQLAHRVNDPSPARVARFGEPWPAGTAR